MAEEHALVVHEDALNAAKCVASRSIDQLIWQGSAEVAKAVAIFGAGIMVLPVLGSISGVSDKACLTYAAHPKRLSKGGLMDRVDLESKFGQLDPARLVEELAGGRAGLDRRLKALSNEDLQEEVMALQDWRAKAAGRLQTLEKRAAWAFLGIPAGSAGQAAIKKAFKKKALELHPDKGGDAERFRLLQEMKALLIAPTAHEKEVREAEEKEREKEAQDEVQREKERERKRQERREEDGKGEDSDTTDVSSDSSYDVSEEFKKMFPKRKKRDDKGKKRREGADDDDLENLRRDEAFNRDKFEAARRKLHRNFVETWQRASQLADEIKRHQLGSDGEALRELRKFVSRFANVEVSKLQDNDPRKAQRILRRFLEQGSEVLCAAAAVDPAAAISSVAMQVNLPLTTMAPSDELQQLCNALLDALRVVPSTVDKFVVPAEETFNGRAKAARESAAPGMRFQLLVPDLAAPLQRNGMEVPGVQKVAVELPADSTLGDLRAAAHQVCGGALFGKAAPRLFCGGKFIAAAAQSPLESIDILREGLPIQCLPSNAAMARMPPPAAPPSLGAAGGKAAAGGAAQSTSQRSCSPSPSTASAAAQAPQRTAEVPAAAAAAAATGEEAPQKKAEAPAAAAAAAATGQEVAEDAWFDDFFSDTKKAADEQVLKEEKVAAEQAEAERQRREAEEQAEERRRAEEKARRKAEQDEGRAALEARQRAQRQAAEAKRKLEKERSKKKKLAERAAGIGADAVKAEVVADAIVTAKGDDILGHCIQKLRSSWEESWEHPCAGDKRPDGSAIFCYPCDGWIRTAAPYEHAAFEAHCEKVGHYGWID